MATRYADPKMEAKIVQEFQELLDTVTWLDSAYNYPIAHIGTQKQEEIQQTTYPQIYINDGESDYEDVRPNDKIQALSFWELNEPYTFDREMEDVNISLSLIIWYNLKRVDNTKSYDFSGELRAEIIQLLYENDVDNDIEIEIRPKEIFDKYNFQKSDLKYLGHPYGASKFTFEKRFEDINCLI